MTHLLPVCTSKVNLLLLLLLQVAYAEYELAAIMVTGSCSEVPAKGSNVGGGKMPPPRGLQLHLGTHAQQHEVRSGCAFTTLVSNQNAQRCSNYVCNPHSALCTHHHIPSSQVDTLVMQNLGYFQLKAAPGLWRLSIAPGAPHSCSSAPKLLASCSSQHPRIYRCHHHCDGAGINVAAAAAAAAAPGAHAAAAQSLPHRPKPGVVLARVQY
jgi:UDP-glucose:Glycoprotein Glucosyltransferase